MRERYGRISIIGAGYVGLTTGVCFAHMGHSVCCIDVDREKIVRLQWEKFPSTSLDWRSGGAQRGRGPPVLQRGV